MPGVARLVRELGVGTKTVVAALNILKREGLLEGQGERRQSRIAATEGVPQPVMRIAFLAYEAADLGTPYQLDLLHKLRAAGHEPAFVSRTQESLGRDLRRVSAYVEGIKADAWVVVAGSLEILRWFEARPVPAFALFGRRRELNLAGGGPDKVPAMREAVGRLRALGHRRIVLLAREERRKPKPGALERAFLDELAAQGITAGAYNLPDWEESHEGLQRVLDSLFGYTPPTALIFEEAPLLTATLQYCTMRGIRVPQDLSMVCCDFDPHFAWCQPAISHIQWDPRPVVSRIVRWAGRVARGIDDRRHTETRARFIEGGTIGPARK